MSNIDKFSKEALREVAEDAQKAHKWEGLENGLKADGYVSTTVRFIQRASPQTVLALLDELEAAEKRIAELSGEFFALPPLNDELIAILGRPNFTCAHLAELLRKGGQDIRRKAECEQAAVIYWFLDLYLKYGDKWEGIAKDDIQARAAMITAGTAKGE